MVAILLAVAIVTSPVLSLDNGLARTPPMGWMSWERFRCNWYCQSYPDDCISDYLIKTTADAMVKYGFKDAGYTYIALDDCWMDKERDKDGKLQGDTQRFPTGMKTLADYVHKQGLKLGLYVSLGNSSCAGYAGSYGHFETDAKTLADWGVDMVKVAACNVSAGDQFYNQAYPQFTTYLNKTGRPMLVSSEWYLYSHKSSHPVNYSMMIPVSNIYRTYYDLEDSWTDLSDKVKHYGDESKNLVNYSIPGSWSDADQVLVGDYGLSLNQQKLQMALWSIMSSPLFVSADVRNMDPQSRAILLNERAIAINQDPLGIMGSRVDLIGGVHIWAKPISPKGSFALALIYTNISGGPKKVSVKLGDLHFYTAAAYNFIDVFENKTMGIYKPWYTLDCEVNPTGVLFIQAIALP